MLDEEHSVFFNSYLPGLERGGRYFVAGEMGDRYSISFRNRSPHRVEAVLSVDGLDVLNGRPAAFGSRGYIVEPGERLIIEGFRESQSTVAAFRFADVQHSYTAEKYGDTKNVGVIGIAVFSELGRGRFASPPSYGQTSTANAFPEEEAHRQR